MNYTILDSLKLTVVAIFLVFLVLLGLMLLMQVSAKINHQSEKKTTESERIIDSKRRAPMKHNSNQKLELVAVLTALAEAAQEEENQHYEIENVERIT